MAMQTDVLVATLLESGLLVNFRTRVKGLSVKGTSNVGSIELFDSLTAPVAATYARTSATITVTKNGHGLQAGDSVGISFSAGTGGSGTSGNYRIQTVPDANTFTVTDINSGSITAGANCLYAGRWILTFRFAAGDVYTNYWPFPGQGVVAENGVHATMTNLTAVSIFYG
jgi:hypothetical protein